MIFRNLEGEITRCFAIIWWKVRFFSWRIHENNAYYAIIWEIQVSLRSFDKIPLLLQSFDEMGVFFGPLTKIIIFICLINEIISILHYLTKFGDLFRKFLFPSPCSPFFDEGNNFFAMTDEFSNFSWLLVQVYQ